MNWDDLRVFLAVARVGSLTAAGRTLRIDPATVGRRVLRFEDQVGSRLFVKSPQGYVLTEEGQNLMAHAEAVEAAVSEAEDSLGEPGQGMTGQVRIAAPDGCANFVLPQVTVEIMRAHPGLDIQIIAAPRPINLSRREADMVISVSRPTAGRLVTQKIADYALHLAASQDYLASRPPIEAPEDLKGQLSVGYIPDMIFDRELDYLAQAGLDAARFGSNSVSVQLQWLRQGAGVGVVHDFALPFAPQLRRVLPDYLSLTRTFWLTRHADDRKVERLNRFSDALVAGLRREIQRLEGLT